MRTLECSKYVRGYMFTLPTYVHTSGNEGTKLFLRAGTRLGTAVLYEQTKRFLVQNMSNGQAAFSNRLLLSFRMSRIV
jgi:hypothetical protein